MIGSPHGTERATPEPSGKSFDAGKPDTLHFTRVAVEHADTVVHHNLMNLMLGTCLEVVVAENGHNWDADSRRKILDQRPCLVRSPVVCEVPRQQQHIGICRDLRQ